MAIPTKDALLVPYSANFATRLVSEPTTYHVAPAAAAALEALAQAYASAVENLMTVRADGTQSKALTASRTDAKRDMLAAVRPLYAQIKLDSGVSDANKILLGVPPASSARTPVPPPAERPVVEVVSVDGHTVNVRLRGTGAVRTRRPSKCVAAWVYSYVGETYPSDPALWTYTGSTSKPDYAVTFHGAPDGAQVFVCAAWINAKQEAGPPSLPVSANLQYGGVRSATKMKVAA